MDPLNDVTLTVNQTFPKGMALAQWLNLPAVNASPTLGQLAVSGSEHSVNTVNPPTTEWMYYSSPRSSQYLSFNTPVGTPEDMQCGKVVFTDIHIQKSISVGGVTTGGDDSDPGKPFPSGCKTNEMSPQAKALEFLFFDLSACVLPDDDMPVPPPVPPPGAARPRRRPRPRCRRPSRRARRRSRSPRRHPFRRRRRPRRRRRCSKARAPADPVKFRGPRRHTWAGGPPCAFNYLFRLP